MAFGPARLCRKSGFSRLSAGLPGAKSALRRCPDFEQRIISAKEAVPIENNEHRNIRRPQNSQSGQSAPRRVNRTPSAGTQRTVNRSAAAGAQRSTGAPRSGGQGSSGAPRSGGHTPKKKKSGVRRFFGGLFRFIAVCICLGVMVASVVAVALSLYLVEATADDNLDLTEVKLAQTTWIMAQDHNTGEWVEYEDFYRTNNREWAELSEIESSPYLKWAFICTEDKDFYEHHGVSFKRTIAAAINEYTPIKLFGGRQGASTLEQQLIKNLTGDDEQDAMRKVREIFRAWGLDNRYNKDTILETYLNTISLTGNTAGVKAGAIQYFGKDDLSQLTAAECASIAAITKSPNTYNPYKNPEEHLQRRNLMLWNMYDQGHLTEEEYNEAVNSPLTLAETDADSSTSTGVRSYFSDAVYTELKQQLVDELGWTEAEAENEIFNGGLRIYATVDPYLQEEMEKMLLNEDESIPWMEREEEFELGSKTEEDLAKEEGVVYNEDGTLKTKTDKDGKVYYYKTVHSQVAMVTMDYNGEIKALVGGLGEKTTDLSLNRANVARQTGSTMKPIAAYSLGIDMGWINYSTNFVDMGVGKVLLDNQKNNYPQYRDKMFENDAPEVLANPGIWRDWPQNYVTSTGHGERTVNVNYALAQSLNTVAVQVGQLVGVESMYTFAKDTVGMSHLNENDMDLAPIVLGSQNGGATPIELAGAYLMFGNGGEYVTPHLYTRVEYATTGEVLIDNEVNVVHTQAIKESTAMIMNRLLQGVLGSSGTASGMKPSGEMEAAAKTGTTTDNKDYTFVGLTPYYVTSMWWGYDKPYDMSKAGAKNAKAIQKVWKSYMETVQEGLEVKQFPVSEDVKTAAFCVDSGDLAGANCPNRQTGYYTADNMPSTCAMHP